MDGEFRKGFPVEFDIGLVQAVDELAVAQAFRPAGGVDADDPKLPEGGFLLPAITISI